MPSTRFALAVLTCAVLAASCQSPVSGPAEVLIEARDYAFLAPDSLPAGPTAFGLANAGTVPHEIILVRLKPDADIREILRIDAADSSWSALRDEPNGILTAAPGITTPGQLLVPLAAGERYLLVCNFQDAATAPTHMHLGMFKVLTVQSTSVGGR